MERNPRHLVNDPYDLVVIGGGIYGAWAALDAALRGLRVAVVERGDFGHATSANCLKIAHSGLRYLQQGDIRQVRESTDEMKALMRVAPHLVGPMPFVIPTYGHGLQGKAFLALGLMLYDLVTLDRNRGADELKEHVPGRRLISRSECIRLFPGLQQTGLTGGVSFYDGQIYNPARLVLACLKSAVDSGAHAGNYLEVTGLLRDGVHVIGVKVRDTLTRDTFEVRGGVVLNATGPWVGQLVEQFDGYRLRPPLLFSKSLYFVTHRPLTRTHALAIPSRHRDPNALISRGRRHLFMIPWRDHTLIGSSHVAYEGSADAFMVSDRDIGDFLDEINDCYPAAALRREDISFYNAGLVPMHANERGSAEARLMKCYRIIDHQAVDGLDGLVTVIGVRFTTARLVAEKAVDLVFRKLGRRPPKARTAVTLLHGGFVGNCGRSLPEGSEARRDALEADVMRQLVRNHGRAYATVIEVVDEDPSLRDRIGDSSVIKAEVIHAVRSEMAQKLGDVVFRRTDLGTTGNPGDSALLACAHLMGRELGWDRERVRREVAEVRRMYQGDSNADS